MDGLVGGRGLGRVCDHINHFGYHIKEIRPLKAWGSAKLKGPWENTEIIESLQLCTHSNYWLLSCSPWILD